MSSEKKLPASAKRRQELRDQGTVIKSPDITTASLLGVGLFTLLAISPMLTGGIAQIMKNCFIDISRVSPSEGLFMPIQGNALNGVLLPLGLLLGSVFFAVVASQVMQVGFNFNDEIFDPKWDKLNPASGITRFFSLRRLVSTAQALLKVLILTFFSYSAVRSLLNDAIFERPISLLELGNFLRDAAWAIGWRILLMLVIFATVDYLYQLWQFERDNRMSEDDLKEEMRSQEGSPEVKMKQRALRRRRSLRRMYEDVQDATIVITNPTHFAIALKYKRGETPVPLVVAKGARLIAQRIKEEAKNKGISMVENKPLAQGLYKHGLIGHPIPVIYYQAVATLLAELYRRGLRDASSGT